MPRKIQHERDEVRRPCIAILRAAIAYRQLRRYSFLYWISPPDPGKKTPQEAYKLKLDGYEKGVYDLTIIAANKDTLKTFLIEFKYDKNKLTPEQSQVWDLATCNQNIHTIIIKSPIEFENFLHKFLK